MLFQHFSDLICGKKVPKWHFHIENAVSAFFQFCFMEKVPPK
jgi:hypothetical protein